MTTLAEEVQRVTGTSPLQCYQCGLCSAGCPQNVEGGMDLSPTRVMRLLQLPDQETRALEAETPWLCAGCLACTDRCPQGIDIAGTMDVLRETALQRGVASRTRRARDIQALHHSFLEGVARSGRMHELALVLEYKLRTGHLLQDALLAPGMLGRGKLDLRPPRHRAGIERVLLAAQRLKEEDEA